MTPNKTDSKEVMQVTPAAVWRAPRLEGYLKQLPSGRMARLRPVSPADLLLRDDLPSLVKPVIARMLFEGIDNPTREIRQMVEQGEGDPRQTSREAMVLYDLVCRLAFVEPQIVDNPQADKEIHIDDVELLDRNFVFNICTLGANALRDFHYDPQVEAEASDTAEPA